MIQKQSFVKTGCGVTAMALIHETMKEDNITPINMAKYSIERLKQVCD